MWYRWFRAKSQASLLADRRGRRASSRRQHARRLLLEGLEDRSLMAFNMLGEYATGAYPVDVVLSDVNGDDRPDMIVANAAGASLDVRFGNGDGKFAPAATLPLGGSPSSVAVGDFDGDGATDIVAAVSNSGESHLSVLSGNGDGTFQPPANLPIPPQSISFPQYSVVQRQQLSSVAAGDLNDDGRMDFVVTGSASEWYCPYYCYGPYGDSYVNVLLGNGSGGFDPPTVYPMGTGAGYYNPVPGNIVIEELTGDGRADVIMQRPYGGLSVFPGDGAGALGSAINSGSGSPLPSLSLGDIDGDGRLDTVLRSGSSLVVQKGNGNGTFTPAAAVDMGQYFDAAVVGDVNGDGKLDLVAVGSPHTCTDDYYYCYSGYTSKLATVVLGNGQGGFASPNTSHWGTVEGTYDSAWYTDLALADLTGDGLADAVALESGGGTAVVAKGSWPPADAPFLNVDSVSVVEGDAGTKEVTLTASLSASYLQTITADFYTADGTAVAGSDYQASSGSLTFAPGDTTRTITITVHGDRLIEADETFLVRLTNVVNANTLSHGTVTILDNEPHLSINHPYSSDPLTVVEGDSGTTPALFTVTLSQPYDQEVTVDYYTLTGHTSDIISVSGTLTFAPGDTSEDIIVQVVGDTIDEPLEAFNVYLTNPSPNASIDNSAGYCYIEDNDPSPTLTISDVTKNEGNKGTTQFQFTLRLSAAAGSGLYVSYSTANGTATSHDYVAKSGTVYFSPGQTTATITIDVKGDRTKEADETFFVNLSNSSGVTIVDSQGLGTIRDDDSRGSGKVKLVGNAETNRMTSDIATWLATSSTTTRKRK